jgi:Kef-type K+ transport system membrane component KefB
MMALILSTTSLGIVVPVLKERQMTTSQYGQTILLAALLADFLTMFMITIYVAGLSAGLTLEILLIGVLFITALVIYRLGSRSLKIPAVTRLIDQISGATSQFKVRTALALMMGFVVLAESVGVELILGAFLAGAVISLLSRPEDQSLKHNLEAMGYGFFIPVFFIMVGVEFDLPVLLTDSSAIILAPLLLLAAFGLKLIGSFAFRLRFSWRQSLAAGMVFVETITCCRHAHLRTSFTHHRRLRSWTADRCYLTSSEFCHHPNRSVNCYDITVAIQQHFPTNR